MTELNRNQVMVLEEENRTMNEMIDLYDEVLMQKAFKMFLLQTEGRTERFFKEEAILQGLVLAVRVIGKYKEYREYAQSEEGKKMYLDFKDGFLN